MASDQKKPFVLIHGGTHGGWCWSRVIPDLQAAGHRVFAPTLTGVGERHHLSGPSVDLNTHIQDVVAVLECEELEQAILVAHSFGGYPMGGAADRVPERISQLIFLDAVIAEDGNAQFDHIPKDVVAKKMATAVEINGAKSFGALSAEFYGVTDPDDIAWVNRRVTPQPAKTYTTPIRLTHPVCNGLSSTYIVCSEPRLTALEHYYGRARQLGMTMMEIATGHDAMVTAPRELAEMLLTIAR